MTINDFARLFGKTKPWVYQNLYRAGVVIEATDSEKLHTLFNEYIRNYSVERVDYTKMRNPIITNYVYSLKRGVKIVDLIRENARREMNLADIVISLHLVTGQKIWEIQSYVKRTIGCNVSAELKRKVTQHLEQMFALGEWELMKPETKEERTLIKELKSYLLNLHA